jgi:hypothetical protein
MLEPSIEDMLVAGYSAPVHVFFFIYEDFLCLYPFVLAGGRGCTMTRGLCVMPVKYHGGSFMLLKVLIGKYVYHCLRKQIRKNHRYETNEKIPAALFYLRYSLHLNEQGDFVLAKN